MEGNEPGSVEFFFDPMCPWAYQASKWIREVRRLVGVVVDWRFFSLEEVNLVGGKPHPWERDWAYGWSAMRVGAWLRRRDMALLDTWYATIGRAFHECGLPYYERDVAESLLAEAGLPPDTIDAALADATTHDDVKADHDRAVGAYAAFGVPTLVLPGGHAVYGPVITPSPMGHDALRLWELVCAWREFPHLYEMQRPKTPGDLTHVTMSFAPYLEARNWPTIEKQTP